MKLLFIATFLLAQSVFAAGLPKTAQLVLQLDQPATTVQFPNLDLTKAKINDSGLVTFSQTGDIKVGNITYKMDPAAFTVLKDDTKGLTVENLKFLRYRLYSEDIKAVVSNLVVDMEKGTVAIYKADVKGVVTEWY